MILCMAEVLTAAELGELCQHLERQELVDGAASAGWHARLVKRNQQLGPGPETRRLQALVDKALARNPLFAIACRPHRIRPALFSSYGPGMAYGTHVDDAVMGGAGATPPLRSDVSFTLFLSEPEGYDGGELVVETSAGEQAFKLEAGGLVLYPSSTLHRVAPVTRGRRLAAVSWVQSQVRDPAQREILFDLDTARRALFEREGKSREFDLLSKSLANLLRMWAEV
jgi:PKHD-type hydroxylase